MRERRSADSTTRAAADVIDALAEAARSSEAALLALAQLDARRAAALLAPGKASGKDGISHTTVQDAALPRIVQAVVRAGLPRGDDDQSYLVHLLLAYPAAITGDLAAAILARAPRDGDIAAFAELAAAALAREPRHATVLRWTADRAVRDAREGGGGAADAHALLTRLARADASLATMRHIARARATLPPEAGIPLRAALLSSFTADNLLAYLDVECRALGIVPDLYLAPFDTWTREILDESSGLRRSDPEIAFLAVSIDDLIPELAGTPGAEELERLGDVALDRVLSAARQFASWSSGSLVVHSFHSAYRDPLGVLSGRESTARSTWLASLNARLAEALRELPRAYLLEMGEVLVHRSGGVADNPKMRHFGAMRLGDQVLGEVARAYARYVAPLKGLTRKCVVLDLDNTLWGGVVGEDGLHGLKLGSTSPGAEFVELQQYLLALTRRGFLLAINSKNNPADALEVLRTHEAMVCREDAFSALRINWRPKPDNMRAIAEELNIGLDSLVFVDDNPKERELMRQALPQVLTPELPADPALWRQLLEGLPQLQTLTVTEEDRSRTEQYRSKRQREEVRLSAASLEEYLTSLGTSVEIELASSATLPRFQQLLQRTNQFNLTTRRHDMGELAARLASPAWRLYTLRARDRFGDHGIVAVAAVHAAADRWQVESFLMSCRVIGYGVETALLATVCAAARRSGAGIVEGEYIATAKNEPARDFYERHGFSEAGATDEGTLWRCVLERGAPAMPHWIEARLADGV